MKLKLAGLLLLSVIILNACGIMGIHFKVHNPKHAGSYPDFDRETILLGELSPVRKSFDVTYYDLDIDINAADKALSGWVAITAKTLQDIDSIQLDLDDPLVIEALNWMTREGKPLKYTRDHRAVYVQLPERLKKGERFTVQVRYGGKPVIAKDPPWRGRLVWKKDKQQNDWIGVACESEGASTWFPCKDHTSDEPDSARMRFSIPESDLMVVSNGVYLGAERQGGKRSFTWIVHNPINLYNITFYVGNFERIQDTYTGIEGQQLELNHYVLRPNAAKAKRHFEAAKKHIRVYEELYGPYAWYTDGFKLVESPYAGMEHQTAIAYGNGYKNDLKKVEDYIMLHEIGHEWFGNAITASDLADVWLQEGITTYGEVLYLERQYGKPMSDSHLNFYKIMIANKRPLVGIRDRRFFDYKDGDAYVKGAWVMHSLRETIENDSVFFSVLKTFYKENKRKVTDSRTFVETTNRVTGQDYNWFFNQYLYRNRAPFLEFEKSRDGMVYYRWVDVAADFKGLKVMLELSNGKKYRIVPTTKVQRLDLSARERMRKCISITAPHCLVPGRTNSCIPCSGYNVHPAYRLPGIQKLIWRPPGF